MRLHTSPLLLTLLFTSCASIAAPSGVPSVSMDAMYASAYWFRGTPINVQGVYQGSLSTSIPTADGGAIEASVWGNIDAKDDTGRAISPDGNERDFTEVDVTLDYSRSFDGIDTSLGLISYNFPNLVGGSTVEVFAEATTELLGLDHSLSLYYDVDELGDLYLSYDMARQVELAEGWQLSLSALLGYMGQGQSELYYGAKHSGLADLTGSASLEYAADDQTTVFLSINGVTAVDSTLSNALDAANLRSSDLWLSLGVVWSL